MFELISLYRVDAQHIASVFLALAIWRWGAAPERWSIAVFIATMVVPVRLMEMFDANHPAFGAYSSLYIGLDFVAGAAFVAVALQANRNYPLWIAGFQLVAIAAHVSRGMVDTVSPLAYLIMAVGPSYCQLLLIFAGFVRHLLRQRRFGPYRAWRTRELGMGQ